MEQLGKNMQAAMTKKGVSVRWLVEHTTLSEKTIDRLRHGTAKNPGIPTVRQVARALDVTIDYLLQDTDVVIATQEIATLQVESDCLADKCNLLEGQNAELTDRIAELTDNVADLTSRLDSTSAENLILREQAVFQASEIKRLEIENTYKDRLLEVHEHYMRKH